MYAESGLQNLIEIGSGVGAYQQHVLASVCKRNGSRTCDGCFANAAFTCEQQMFG
jgi:hypothetical protein